MPTKGFPCPDCNARTFVQDSRNEKDGVRRRRECVKGHRFTTYEHLGEFGSRRFESPWKKSAFRVVEEAEYKRIREFINTVTGALQVLGAVDEPTEYIPDEVKP